VGVKPLKQKIVKQSKTTTVVVS